MAKAALVVVASMVGERVSRSGGDYEWARVISLHESCCEGRIGKREGQLIGDVGPSLMFCV
jgi:hypothetical protein